LGFRSLGGLKWIPFSRIKGGLQLMISFGKKYIYVPPLIWLRKKYKMHPSSNKWGLFTVMEPFPLPFRTTPKECKGRSFKAS